MSHNLAYSEGSGQPYRMAKRRRLKAQIRLQLRQALSCAREPIGHSLRRGGLGVAELAIGRDRECCSQLSSNRDRKSTRLNSSHVSISYAVFCLKKKKKI